MGSKEIIFVSEDSAPYGHIIVASSKQRFGKMAKEKHRPRERRRFIRLYAHAVAVQIDLVDSNDCE